MGIRSSEACREQVVWHGGGPWVRGRSRRWGVAGPPVPVWVDETRTRLLTRVLAAVKPARAAVEKCAVMTNPESRGDERWRPGRRRAASARRDTGDRGATTVRSGRDSDPDSRWTPGWRPASECSVDHSSGLVFRRPQATLTADLWSIFAPPFSDLIPREWRRVHRRPNRPSGGGGARTRPSVHRPPLLGSGRRAPAPLR